MPAEYTACWKSLTRKGVPVREAKGRCAASFFKRHGITVNEAHERGVAEFLGEDAQDLDMKLVEAIMDPSKRAVAETEEWLEAQKRPPTTVQTLIFSKKRFKTADAARSWAKSHGHHAAKVDETEDSFRLRQRDPGDFVDGSFRTITLTNGVKAVIGHLKSAKAENMGEAEIRFDAMPLQSDDEDGNIFTLVAAKTGSMAFLPVGLGLSWTRDSLAEAAPTWAGQNVTINHEKPDMEAGIVSSRFEDDELLMTVETTDDLAEHIRAHWPEVGVSVEADIEVVDFTNLEILRAHGKGVSFIFYPRTAACDAHEGCMIIGEEKPTDEVTSMGDCEKCESLGGKMNDLVSLIAAKDVQIKDLSETKGTHEEELTSLRSFKEDTEGKIAAHAELELTAKKLKEENTSLMAETEQLRKFKEEADELRKATLLEKIEDAGLETDLYKEFEVGSLEVVANVVVALGRKKGEEEASGAKPTRATASKPGADDFDFEAAKREEELILQGKAP